MDVSSINWLAVLVAGISSFILGGVWYSPALFGTAWMKENNFTGEEIKKFNPARTYSIVLILSVIISYNLAFFLGDSKTGLAWGTTAGFLAGFGFSALIFTIVSLFEQRSWKYILINGGYITVYFTLIGFILGIWR